MSQTTIDANQQKFLEILQRFYKAADVKTILEVGARDCGETKVFAQTFSKASIYTFECNPQTLPLCRKVAKQYPAITLVEKAVSDTNGSVDFFPIDPEKTETTWKDGNPGASSLLQASGKYPVEKYVQKKITVEATRLDAFLESQKISQVDVMWMDIQGAELMALKGLGQRLQDVKIIHTEVEFMEIYSGQPLYKDIQAFLQKNGFTFIGFTFKEEGLFADAVFVENRFLKSFGAANYLKHRLRSRLPGTIYA
jgi:FkbM family methyltransferase